MDNALSTRKRVSRIIVGSHRKISGQDGSRGFIPQPSRHHSDDMSVQTTGRATTRGEKEVMTTDECEEQVCRLKIRGGGKGEAILTARFP